MQQEKKNISASNLYCFECALYNGDAVPATRMVWSEETNMCIPLCDECFQEVESEEKNFFSVFSKN